MGVGGGGEGGSRVGFREKSRVVLRGNEEFRGFLVVFCLIRS